MKKKILQTVLFLGIMFLTFYTLLHDRDIIPAKVVYVRNRNKRKESLCLISTDVNAKATLT